MSISTSYDAASGSDGVWHDAGLQYSYKAEVLVRQLVPSVADQAGGAAVSVHGSGLVVASGVARTYCAVGGSMLVQSTWGYNEASSVQCRVSGGASGMQVLELSLGEGGVITE